MIRKSIVVGALLASLTGCMSAPQYSRDINDHYSCLLKQATSFEKEIEGQGWKVDIQTDSTFHITNDAGCTWWIEVRDDKITDAHSLDAPHNRCLFPKNDFETLLKYYKCIN